MLTELARAQGTSDCLAKFAIDAKGFQELERVYGHLPPEQFNAAVKARADQEFKRGGGIMDPLGVANQPYSSAANPTIGGGTGPTHVRPRSPNISFNREQLLQMPAGDVHKTLTGRAPTPPPQAPVSIAPPTMRPAAGSAAGTVAGRINPLLAKR